MIRVVLAGWKEDDWRIYRQSQWMGEVRRDPSAASLPRHQFDIGEDAYSTALADWERARAGASRETARDYLARFGAVEILRA